MTPRERKRGAAYFAFLCRQQPEQTGVSSKWNIPVDDGGAEVVVMLLNVTEERDGV